MDRNKNKFSVSKINTKFGKTCLQKQKPIDPPFSPYINFPSHLEKNQFDMFSLCKQLENGEHTLTRIRRFSLNVI